MGPGPRSPRGGSTFRRTPPKPEARSERLNCTFQDWLGQRAARGGDYDGRRLRMCTCGTCSCPSTTRRSATHRGIPTRPGSTIGDVDLDQVLCHSGTRGVVARDNTVTSRPGRSCRLPVVAGPADLCRSWRSLVRRHLDGRHSVWRGPQPLGHFTADGQPPWTLSRLCTAARPGLRTPAGWTGRTDRRPAHSAHRQHCSESGQFTCQTEADNSLVNNSTIAPLVCTKCAATKGRTFKAGRLTRPGR